MEGRETDSQTGRQRGGEREREKERKSEKMERKQGRNGKRKRKKESKKEQRRLVTTEAEAAERSDLTDAASWGHGGSGSLVRVTDDAEETLVTPPPPPPLLPPPPPSVQRETCNSLENATLFARLCNNPSVYVSSACVFVCFVLCSSSFFLSLLFPYVFLIHFLLSPSFPIFPRRTKLQITKWKGDEIGKKTIKT